MTQTVEERLQKKKYGRCSRQNSSVECMGVQCDHRQTHTRTFICIRSIRDGPDTEFDFPEDLFHKSGHTIFFSFYFIFFSSFNKFFGVDIPSTRWPFTWSFIKSLKFRPFIQSNWTNRLSSHYSKIQI